MRRRHPSIPLQLLSPLRELIHLPAVGQDGCSLRGDSRAWRQAGVKWHKALHCPVWVFGQTVANPTVGPPGQLFSNEGGAPTPSPIASLPLLFSSLGSGGRRMSQGGWQADGDGHLWQVAAWGMSGLALGWADATMEKALPHAGCYQPALR